MTTLYEAKGQARRLAEYLSSLNLTLNHGQSLEAVARSLGAPSWNVFASEAESSTSFASANPANHGVSVDPGLLSFSGLVSHAIAHEYGPIHIEARHHATTIRQRIRGTLVEVAKLGAAETLELAYDMGWQGKRSGEFELANGEKVPYHSTRLKVVGGADTVIHFPRKLKPHELGLTEMRKWAKLLESNRGLLLLAGPSNSACEILQASLGIGMHGTDLPDSLVTLTDDWGCLSHVGTNLSFEERLSRAMRMDPRALIVNITTKESLSQLVQVLETGHFVIATVQGKANPLEALRTLLETGNSSEATQYEFALERHLRGVLSHVPAHPFCEFCSGDGCAHCFKTGNGPVEYLSSLWVPSESKGVSELLTGKLSYRTPLDDLAVKEATGLMFSTDTISRVRSLTVPS